MNDESILTDAIGTAIASSVSDLAAVNAPAIAAALAEVEANKLTVSISIKFQRAGAKLVHQTRISFATKHQDESEGIIDLDKQQMKLGETK
jgi:hypothetical protein